MNSKIWFHNRYGEAKLTLDSKQRFIDKHGMHLGYIYDGNKIYNYDGKHCGWIENYVIRDLEGRVAGYCEISNDSPVPFFPFRQFEPFQHFIKFEPSKSTREYARYKPFKSFGWSNTSLIDLFKK